MSLLLDALKKAERAKDDALRREQLADGSDPEPVQVRTRNELPDISRPLELHSEDVPGRQETARAESPVPDAFATAPRPAAREPAHPQRNISAEVPSGRSKSNTGRDNAPDPQSAQRAAAKQVFEAKFREPNPRLPFLITMGLLGVFALGTVVYFWFQLRPPPPLVNPNAKPPAEERKVDALPARSAASEVLPAKPGTASPSTEGQPISGLPTNRPEAQSSTLGTTPPQPLSSSPAVVATSKPATTAPSENAQGNRPATSPRQGGTSREPRAIPDSSQLRINRVVPSVDPKIETAWQAYNRGDLTAARSNYQAMLREEPANRDALLGLAAIEIRSNRPEQAEIHYRNLLQLNPKDPYAQTGLLSIRGQIGDPVQAESRVKNLLANDPEAQVLNFTLGNQYAQQGRWPEAQQAYFKAYSADPENPDFAYNLAVSLDQIRQPKAALEYYRRALALSQQRSGIFDHTLARNRVQELTK